ncbi:RNA pyrophosphohydrolase [Brevundimonas vesicularis]|uniref:RNA pyrophosphohydrolase n=1 Tax=Brevundimonas vesicularis TaxID=41276 RepID=A0A2X1BM93_BREVE|nr:RNA pyrophosphohydrolase [Brevundimonas vesicularis]
MNIQNNDDNIFDAQGFRYNVGIVIINARNEVFWARRVGQNAWQFPQGGMVAGESAEQAMYRELNEETGLLPEHVELLAQTKSWLAYRLPLRFRRRRRQGMVQCIGQKQKWFLLRLKAAESMVNLNVNDSPEFEQWQWVDFWRPALEVVHFKRRVYQAALEELAGLDAQLLARKPDFSPPQSDNHAKPTPPAAQPKRKVPSFAKRRRKSF